MKYKPKIKLLTRQGIMCDVCKIHFAIRIKESICYCEDCFNKTYNKIYTNKKKNQTERREN